MGNYTSQKTIDIITYPYLWSLWVKGPCTQTVRSMLQRILSVTWWLHQMETFSALLAICAGNSPVIGEFPTQRLVTSSFDVSFDLRPKNGWVNNPVAGDLRRNDAHYDVTVMTCVSDGWFDIHQIWRNPYNSLLYSLFPLIPKQWHTADWTV